MSPHGKKKRAPRAELKADATAEALNTFLDREVTFAWGGCAMADVWKNQTMDLRRLLGRLRKHEAGEKDGSAITQGELLGKERASDQVKAQHILMVDVDTGLPFDEIAERIRQHNLFCCLWHTHSNGTMLSRVADKELRRFRSGLPEAPDSPEARAAAIDYLRERKKYDERILTSVGGCTWDVEKREWTISHMPMEKTRALFVLERPFPVAEHGVEGIENWRTKYIDVCHMLDLPYDKSCTDTNRLMYLPRRPEGSDAKLWRTRGLMGKALDLDTVPHVACSDAPRKSTSQRAKEASQGARGSREEPTTSFKTPGLRDFLREHGRDFEAADWVKATSPQDVRRDYGERKGKGIDARCPFGAGHTKQDDKDRGFAVRDASKGRNDHGFWMNCLHAGCGEETQKDRGVYLDHLCQDYGVKHADELLAWCPNHKSEGANAPIKWPVMIGKGDKERPDPNSQKNVAHLLEHLNVAVRLDKLSGDRRMGDELLNDSALIWMWARARELGLSCSFDGLVRLVFVIADGNRFHPVRDYFEAAEKKWDGKPRLDTWLSTYAGAKPTELNSHFGRVFLLGAVKRILDPGCKFDYALVLEDKKQGTGKSSLVQILGGKWYADSLKLGMDAKETIERTRGVWIQEVPELGGMQNREVEAIKAQITTPSDRARMAYGRTTEVVPRQFVLFCTTNDETYLKDRTGNRRFLPVRAGKIDLKALARDRDQLLAEAYVRAKDGESTVLPEAMWEAAREAQDARVEVDPIKEQLTDVLEGLSGRILKEALGLAMGRPPSASRTQREKNQLTAAMRELGWATAKPWHRKKRRECPCYAKGSNKWLELTSDGTFV